MPRSAPPGLPGTVVAWETGTFHRGTALTIPRGARYTMHLAYRPASVEWGQRMSWPMRSHEPEWYQFVHRADTEAARALRFPAARSPVLDRGHLAGTAQRYPRLDMTPWRQALRGEGDLLRWHLAG